MTVDAREYSQQVKSTLHHEVDSSKKNVRVKIRAKNGRGEYAVGTREGANSTGKCPAKLDQFQSLLIYDFTDFTIQFYYSKIYRFFH